jgi:ribosomal 50S subunit-associated protein YjgA (DUF615 family)
MSTHPVKIDAWMLPNSSCPGVGARQARARRDLRASVDRARAVTAHVARRRAERTLAGDLRQIDLVAHDARLAQVQTTGAAEPQRFG